MHIFLASLWNNHESRSTSSFTSSSVRFWSSSEDLMTAIGHSVLASVVITTYLAPAAMWCSIRIPVGGARKLVGCGNPWNKGHFARGVPFLFPHLALLHRCTTLSSWTLFRGILFPSGSISQLDDEPVFLLLLFVCRFSNYSCLLLKLVPVVLELGRTWTEITR